MLAGKELGQQRRGNRVVGADGNAEQEPPEHQLPDVGGECAEDGEHCKCDQVQDVHGVPADLVRDPAEDTAAKEDANQAGGADHADFLGAQVQGRGHGDQCDANDRQRVAVYEGSAGGKHGQLLALLTYPWA